MTSPIKKAGFRQGIYDESNTALEEVGTLRILKDGTMFRYAKAGGALAMGKACIKKAGVSALINNAQTGQGADSGSYTLTVVVASTTLAKDELKGGYIIINDVTGEGARYQIAGNASVTTGTSVAITLRDPLVEDVAAASEVTLLHNPYYGVTQSATEENPPAGIPLIDVTSGYYCWLQTHGIANVLISGSPPLGCNVTLAGTAGAVGAFTATTVLTYPLVGRVAYAAGVTTEYRPIDLLID